MTQFNISISQLSLLNYGKYLPVVSKLLDATQSKYQMSFAAIKVTIAKMIFLMYGCIFIEMLLGFPLLVTAIRRRLHPWKLQKAPSSITEVKRLDGEPDNIIEGYGSYQMEELLRGRKR